MPRFVRVLGAVLGVFLLTFFFFLLGFPWDLLARRIAHAASETTGFEIEMERVSPFVSFAGPGVQARGLRVKADRLPTIEVDRVRVRPAWSLSWLQLDPSIYVDVESPYGRVAGALTVGGTRRFDGWLEDLDLGRIPVDLLPPGLELAGRISAIGDVSLRADGMPEGDVTIKAADGLVNQNSFPVALKFDTLAAEVALGGDALARISSLQLVGPTFDAEAKGELASATNLMRSAVDIQAQVKVKAPGLLMMARDFGVDLDPQGSAKFRLGGTLGDPEIVR